MTRGVARTKRVCSERCSSLSEGGLSLLLFGLILAARGCSASWDLVCVNECACTTDGREPLPNPIFDYDIFGSPGPHNHTIPAHYGSVDFKICGGGGGGAPGIGGGGGGGGSCVLSDRMYLEGVSREVMIFVGRGGAPAEHGEISRVVFGSREMIGYAGARGDLEHRDGNVQVSIGGGGGGTSMNGGPRGSSRWPSFGGREGGGDGGYAKNGDDEEFGEAKEGVVLPSGSAGGGGGGHGFADIKEGYDAEPGKDVGGVKGGEAGDFGGGGGAAYVFGIPGFPRGTGGRGGSTDRRAGDGGTAAGGGGNGGAGAGSGGHGIVIIRQYD